MKVYTRKGDDGSHRPPLRQPGREGLRRPVGLRRGRRGGVRPGPGPGRDRAGSELNELLVRLQRELFVAGAELATAPENRAKLTPGVSLVTAEMVAALEPIIDDITARYDPPQEFVLPGENRVAAALDLARCVVRRAERAVGGRHPRRLARPGRQPRRALPQPPGRSRLHAGPLAGGRLAPRPHLALGTDVPTQRRSPPMPITASPLQPRRRPRSTADVLAVPGLRRPGARPGRQGARHRHRRLARRRSWPRPGSRARRRRPWPCRPASSAPRAALLVGLGDKKTVSADGLRRAAAAVVRRSPKAKTVATTLLDAVPTGGDRVGRRPGAGRGRGARRLQVPALQAEVRGPGPGAAAWCWARRTPRCSRALDRGMAVAAAVAWARDLVNEPAGAMTPIAAGRGGPPGGRAGRPRHRGPRRGGDRQPGPRRAPRRVARLRPAAPAGEAHLHPQGQGHRHRRPRRQGHHVRLRRPVAQDRPTAWRR